MNASIRSGLIAMLGLLLSGCYASDRLLFDPADAVHPLEDGVYVRKGDPSDKAQVTLEPDGWYAIAKYDPNGMIGETHRVLAIEADLGGRDGYALAEQTSDGFIYGVAFVEDGRVYLATPDCADSADRDDAVDHGGEPQDDEAMTQNCLFRSRDAVLAALSGFAGHAVYGEPYQRH
ncbi:MAG TPA: hypothetical protein VN805_16515 [Caulobacteraceae bacterium]|nr:hypothetical protein [Caulobacteraceae bacterium]